MKKPSILTKILAPIGTILVWLPILAPILFSAGTWLERQHFNFDYLMPLELFPFELVGAGLLIWAALNARLRVKLIGWSLAAAGFDLVLGAVFMSVSGLASGKNEPTGILLAFAIFILIVYILAIIVAGIGGCLLNLDLWHKSR